MQLVVSGVVSAGVGAVVMVVVVVVVKVVATQVPHITGHFNVACLPTKLSRAQSEMLYEAPQYGGSGFPLHESPVVVLLGPFAPALVVEVTAGAAVVIWFELLAVVVAVVMMATVVAGVGIQVPHITGQFDFACLPTTLLRAQSEMLYVAPQSDGSGFPLHSLVVVVVVVVVVVKVAAVGVVAIALAAGVVVAVAAVVTAGSTTVEFAALPTIALLLQKSTSNSDEIRFGWGKVPLVVGVIIVSDKLAPFPLNSTQLLEDRTVRACARRGVQCGGAAAAEARRKKNTM